MATDRHLPPEGVGAKFSLPAMVRARDLTFDAVRQIGTRLKPGVSEEEAHRTAGEVLAGLGMERIWHKSIVRFGEGTLDTFHAPMQPDRILQPNDIFFVDLGAVFDGHEGDAGDTFVVGDDPDMHACAQAARDLWHDVAARWRGEGLSGKALYQYAVNRAEAMGWRLNWHVKGHRVSDFPHAIYKAGALGAMETCPATGLWILEIQIAHPTRPIGAFYEDLLIRMSDVEAAA